MQKLLAVFCIALALSTVSSQSSCTATAALRAQYGLTNSLTTAATQTGVNFCKSIKTGPLCCTADQMNTFQTKSDTLVTNLQNAVGSKDVAAQAIGGGNAQAALTQANNDLVSAVSSLFPGSGAATDAGVNAFILLLQIGIGFDPRNISSQLAGTFSNITTSLTSYQQARSNCAVELVKTQASAWCLSCDPNAANNGYNSTTNTVTMSNDVCTRLKTACYDYIAGSNLQNVALQIGPLVSYIQSITNGLKGKSTTDASSFVTTLGTGSGATSFYTNAPQVQSAELPAGCTSATNCDWICTDLFKNGNITSADFLGGGTPVARPTNVATSLVNVGVVPTGSLLTQYLSGLGLGGLTGLGGLGGLGDLSNLFNLTDNTGETGDTNSVRLLEEPTWVVAKAEDVELSGLRSGRMLYNAGTTNTFNPASDEAGTSVTFKNDPSNVNNGGSGGSGKSAVRYYGSVLAAMVIAVCSMML